MIPILIILALIVALDATGDGFRARGWQVAHHTAEWLVIALFFYLIYHLVIVYYGEFIHMVGERFGDTFDWKDSIIHEMIELAVFYLAARITFFDQIINIVRKKDLWYYSDRPWGKLMKSWAGVPIKLMALVTFITTIIKLLN